MQKSAFSSLVLVPVALGALVVGTVAAAAPGSPAGSKAVVKASAKPSAEPVADAKDEADGFAGLLAIVNKNPNDAAQLDHVRLLSTDKELNDRVDINAIHKYIVSACATVTTFFNSTAHGRPMGLSVNCDLLPGGQAIYQIQVRPEQRQNIKRDLALTHTLEKVKVPLVTGQISLQILIKVWYPKPAALAFFNKGFALQKADQNKEAIQLYGQAISADPADTEAYTCRAIAYNTLKQYDKAVIDLTKAISLGSHDAYLTRASAYRHLKNTDSAMADCNQAIKLDPNYWEGYVSRAELWQDKGNYVEAKKDCDKVIGFMSNCGYAYLVRGEAQLGLKDMDGAVRDLSMAIDLLGKSADAYHYRAQAYKMRGSDEDAAADETRAKALGYLPIQ